MTWLLFSMVSGAVVPDYTTVFKSHYECQAVASQLYTKNKPIACFTSAAKFKHKKKKVKKNVARAR
jgi:hypothetical protein